MMDAGRLIVEAAEMIVDIQKDQIDTTRLSEANKKKAQTINQCLKIIRTSERKLFAIQQKLLADSQQEKAAFSLIKPYAPDINLLNSELLRIAENGSTQIYDLFIEPTHPRSEALRPLSNEEEIRWIPRVVDAVIFLYAPYEIFPFLNSIREMILLIDDDERRMYLLNYIERWLYKFTDFLHSLSDKGQDSMLNLCFLGKHEHYPVILQVIRFLHQKENWDGPSAQIQRYNMVRLFLIFKKVLYLHIKAQNVPETFRAILSEFTHAILAEEINVPKDTLMIVALGFYYEPERFHFMANLKRANIERFVELYQQLLILLESPQSQGMKQKFMENIETMNRIIKKSHLLTDPSIPETLKMMLRREISRQILTKQDVPPVSPSAVAQTKRLSAQEKLTQLKQQVLKEVPKKQQSEPDTKPLSLVSTPAPVVVAVAPPAVAIQVFQDSPRQRNYSQSQVTAFPLVPEQVNTLKGWNFTSISIVQPEDTLFYLLSNFKVLGTLKFAEMLALARVPFYFEFFTQNKERHLKFVHLAHLISMQMSPDDAKILFPMLESSGQLTTEDVDLLMQLLPVLLSKEALGDLGKLTMNRQKFVSGTQINHRVFFETYNLVSENMILEFPYFQQPVVYWNFLDAALLETARKIDRDNCHSGYDRLRPDKLATYLETNQVDLFKRMEKMLKTQFHSTFLFEYLMPKLGQLLEYKITPDLMRLCQVKAVKLY
ncbi:MAG: hypothetical protein HQM12_13360 [SAR324 cluster bacterium]|nr:hypothetical protein [SAR324 cluster bacterium]